MKPIFLVVLLLVSSLAVAQEVLWVKQSEQLNPSEGFSVNSMAKDHAGNLLAIYFLKRSGKLNGQVFTSTLPATSELLLVKYDADANITWTKQLGYNTSNAGIDLDFDQSDNIVVTGSIPSNNIVFGQTMAAGNAFVAKLNSSGDLLWIKQYGDDTGTGQQVSFMSDGTIVAGGRFDSKNNIVIRYSPNGDQLWSVKATYLSCCLGIGVWQLAIDKQDNIVIGGSFSGRTSFNGTVIQSPFKSLYFWKLDATGKTIWLRQADEHESLTIPIVGMDIDEDNNIYATGNFSDDLKFGTTLLSQVTGNSAGYIVKIDASGTFAWAKQMSAGEVYPLGLTFNHEDRTVNVTGRAIGATFRFGDYVSTAGNPGYIMSLNRDGELAGTTIITSDEPYIDITKVIYGSDATYVIGDFAGDATIGCHQIQNGQNNFSTFLYKTGSLPKVLTTPRACIGTTFDVTLQNATTATTFDWKLSPGLEAVDGNLQTTGGQIMLRATAANEAAYVMVDPASPCYADSYFSGNFEIATLPGKPPLPVGPATICAGSLQEYSVTALPSVNEYEWETSGSITTDGSSNINKVTIKLPGESQTGTIRVRATNECGTGSFSDAVTVTTHSLQPAVISGSNKICQGASNVPYTVASAGAQSFTWTLPAAAKMVALKPDNSSISVSFPDESGQKTIVAKAKGVCRDTTSTFKIDVTPRPVAPATVSGETILCKGTGPFVYEATTNQTGVLFHWSVPAGYNIVSQAGNSVNVSIGNQAESGTIKARVSNECFTSPETSLNVAVGTVPDEPEIVRAECDRLISYDGTSDVAWYRNNILVGTEKQFTVLDSGVYVLRVLNMCGATSSEVVELHPIVEDKIVIPNVITADGNGKNDYFVIDRSLRGSALEIFNRWGKSVYQSDNYDNSWGGGDLSAGVYYYVVRNGCLSKPLNGYVSLIR